MSFMNVLLVGLGGFLGSVSRYGLGVAAEKLDWSFPGGTLAANILGCYVIGVATALAENLQPAWFPREARLFVATGFCGGLTTLSTFILDSARLMRGGDIWLPCLYIGLTLTLSAVAFGLGLATPN